MKNAAIAAEKFVEMDAYQLFRHMYDRLPITSDAFLTFHAEIISMAKDCMENAKVKL